MITPRSHIAEEVLTVELGYAQCVLPPATTTMNPVATTLVDSDDVDQAGDLVEARAAPHSTSTVDLVSLDAELTGRRAAAFEAINPPVRDESDCDSTLQAASDE